MQKQSKLEAARSDARELITEHGHDVYIYQFGEAFGCRFGPMPADGRCQHRLVEIMRPDRFDPMNFLDDADAEPLTCDVCGSMDDVHGREWRDSRHTDRRADQPHMQAALCTGCRTLNTDRLSGKLDN